MATGLLEVSGSIQLDQFWPVGTSDADTTKILVHVDEKSFRFRRAEGATFQTTHAFENALVIGKRGRRPAIREGGVVVIRLQGIDAPELHYRPASARRPKDRTPRQAELYVAWNYEYRQPLAESGTIALRALLADVGANPAPCIVRTAVDTPNQVFDTYGRFVGDVHVALGSTWISVNEWLVANGWAVPALYSSMAPEEIRSLLAAAAASMRDRRGVWKKLGASCARFDWDRRYRGKGAAPDASADTGSILVPKLFRRQSAWAVNRRAEMVEGTFASYLAARPEGCYVTEQFLEQGIESSTHRRLDEFVTSEGNVTMLPGDVVFQEDPSLVRGADGEEVTW